MWKEKYRIGIDKIDEQHQELFRRVSEFVKTVQSSDDWDKKSEKVKETLEFMKAYVVEHFEDEEAYQREINFPGYQKHKEIHDKFREEIQNYAEQFAEEGFAEDKVQELGGKLMSWLIYHVADTDQKLGQYVESQGGGQS